MDEILAFAELERFANLELKHYSSGMASRLAYAVAFQAVREVLVLDEIFAVGDAGFRQRCEDRYRELRAAGHTVLAREPRAAHRQRVLRPRDADRRRPHRVERVALRGQRTIHEHADDRRLTLSDWSAMPCRPGGVARRSDRPGPGGGDSPAPRGEHCLQVMPGARKLYLQFERAGFDSLPRNVEFVQPPTEKSLSCDAASSWRATWSRCPSSLTTCCRRRSRSLFQRGCEFPGGWR